MQLNRDLVGYFDSRRPPVVLEAPDKPFDFAWPQPEALRAAGGRGSLLQLRGVSYTYPGAQAPVIHVSSWRRGGVMKCACLCVGGGQGVHGLFLEFGVRGSCTRSGLLETLD